MNLWKKTLPVMAIVSVCFSLTGCIHTSGEGFGATTGAFGSSETGYVKYYDFDVPPQIVYRIDDHRFFTLENYKDCEHGGIVYYNDTEKRIKKYLRGGSDSNSIQTVNPIIYWKGDFIYAASDGVVAFPWKREQTSERDTYGTGVYVYHSNNRDGKPIATHAEFYPGQDLTLVITDKAIYNINPKSIQGYRVEKYNIPVRSGIYDGVYDTMPVKAKTPSGAVRFTCNDSIKSKYYKKTVKQNFATDATDVPYYE